MHDHLSGPYVIRMCYNPAYRIWEHLMELTLTANFTIIITTHYIEEARQAHTVIIVCDLNCSTNVILL